MGTILTHGFYKPSQNDRAGIVFPALETNWQLVNDHTHNGTNSAKISADDTLPSQTGNSGKALFTNGTNVSWANPFPLQTGNAGKFLTTNGTITSWADTLPSQTGNAGKVLSTNGTIASWQVSPSAGVSTDLSNLTPTAINMDLLSNADNTLALGSPSNRWNAIWGDTIAATNSIGIRDTSGNPIFTAIATGPNGLFGGYFRDAFILTGADGFGFFGRTNNSANKTSTLLLRTGNNSVGDSGDIIAAPGTSGTTRGKFKVQDGSQGTLGHVLTEVNADGSVAFAAPTAQIGGRYALMTNTFDFLPFGPGEAELQFYTPIYDPYNIATNPFGTGGVFGVPVSYPGDAYCHMRLFMELQPGTPAGFESHVVLRDNFTTEIRRDAVCRQPTAGGILPLTADIYFKVSAADIAAMKTYRIYVDNSSSAGQTNFAKCWVQWEILAK